MTHGSGAETAGRARRARPLWFHGLCTLGLAFICQHALLVSGFLSDTALVVGVAAGIVIVPLVILLRVLLASRTRVRWPWIAAAAAGAVALAPAWWMPLSFAHAKLENTLYLLAPTAFVACWCCVGMLMASWLAQGRAAKGRLWAVVVAVAALAAGVYGLLQLYLPALPTPSDDRVFLLSSAVVLEAAVCYSVIWLGMRPWAKVWQLLSAWFVFACSMQVH